ncbi:MAG: TonB-dependent receptor [Hyphomonadaceae bacterium]|nr:TonB-dependent receptor [Hyphomonadaceae bacterium]
MSDEKIAFKPKFWLFSAVSAAVGFAGVAYAQQPPATVGDVVVTAQRRAQSVQDVPIAVSAFTAETLRERQVSDVASLSNLTPNVTLDATTPFSGSTSVLAASIRGIGQNDFAFNFDPGVGIYVDGVYLARSVGANTDLLDVERIEVLKGPQGTLFGRNAIGGAISIVTRDPAPEFGYTADITTGSFNRFDVRGTVDLPLDPSFRMSVSFSSKQRDGYVERIALPQALIAPGIPDCVAAPAACSYIVDDLTKFPQAGYASDNREGGQGEFNIRTKFLWEATPTFTARLALDYTNVDQQAAANTLLSATNTTNPALGLPATPPATNFGSIYNACISTANPATVNFVFFPVPGVQNLGTVCGFRGTVPGTVPVDDRYFPFYIPLPFAGANVDGNPSNNRLPWDGRYVTGDIDKSYATGNNFSRLTQWGGALTLDWRLADNLALKSISSFRRLSWSAGMDLDGSPLRGLEISLNMHQEQISQEFQLNGQLWDDRLDYVLGAYYFQEEGDLHDMVIFRDGLLMIDGPNDLKTTAWAVFAHSNIRLTEQLGLTLGVRYTEENKEFQGFQADTNGFNYKLTGCYPPGLVLAPNFTCVQAAGFPDPTDPLRFFPPGVDERSFTDTSPRIGLEYHITDDHMLYASYAKGFKSGSWTTRLSAPLPPGDPKRIFNPEEATSYEIGLKSQYFDNALRINSAAFFTDYQDIQLQQFEAISPTFRNAGDAEIYGGEVELQAVLGNGFSLAGALGYMHAEYTRVAAGVNVGGELPKTPEWSLNLAPQYEMGLNGGAALIFGADYTYRSEVFNDTENNPENSRPALNMINVSATYRSPDERWEIGIGGTNVTDERYVVNGVIQPANGINYGTYNPPAQWFARLRIHN